MTEPGLSKFSWTSASANVRYSDSFVTFIDILGFADMIERSETDETIVPSLHEALRAAPSSSPVIGPPNYPKGLTYAPHMATNFSDSIVISAGRHAEGLMTVLETGRAFASVLLQNGLLCRGGVAGGGLVHETGLLFGPGLVTAYRLESTTAKFARIILSNDCAMLVEDEIRRRSLISEYFRETLRRDTDGFWYIHVLREMEADAVNAPSHAQWWWGRVRETVQTYLDRSRGQTHHDKVVWFSDYFDRCLAGAPQDVAGTDWRRRFGAP